MESSSTMSTGRTTISLYGGLPPAEDSRRDSPVLPLWEILTTYKSTRTGATRLLRTPRSAAKCGRCATTFRETNRTPLRKRAERGTRHGPHSHCGRRPSPPVRPEGQPGMRFAPDLDGPAMAKLCTAPPVESASDLVILDLVLPKLSRFNPCTSGRREGFRAPIRMV